MDYVIIANGDFLAQEILSEICTPGKKIIALDGAALPLVQRGIKPDIILGDLDSLMANTEHHYLWQPPMNVLEQFAQDPTQVFCGKYGITIIYTPNQCATDLEKAIHYCDQHAATLIEIVCACGSRLDHELGNIRLLKKYFQSKRSIIFYTESQILQYACNEKVILQGEINDYCGIMAFPQAAFSSEGLKYNGNNFPLIFGESESTCNQLIAKNASLDIQGNALVIHPPQLNAQRHFMKLSPSEKLHVLLYQQDFVLHELTVKELQQKFFKQLTEAKTNFPHFDKNAIFFVSHDSETILTKLAADEIVLISKRI